MSAIEFRIHRDTWMSANDRHHWARKAQRTRELRHLGCLVAKRDGLAAANLGPTHVTAHIGYPRAGKVDPANANPTVKALIDGMVDAGVWVDDDSAHIVGPDFRLDESTRQKGIYSVRLVLSGADEPVWQQPEHTPALIAEAQRVAAKHGIAPVEWPR